jgi:predicted phage replisome organizer
MGDVTWIKLYIDMFDKRKIKKLRRLPAGNDLLLIWIMLLATAGKCNAGGMIFITESVPFTEEDLADELGFEVTTIKLALKSFEELDMIAYSNDGFINIVGWEEHQNTDRLAEIREYNRLAKQKSRAKQKLLQAPSDDVNDKSMTSQPCHDIEEEGEEDKEEEKETHSIILAKKANEDNEFSTRFPHSLTNERIKSGRFSKETLEKVWSY